MTLQFYRVRALDDKKPCIELYVDLSFLGIADTQLCVMDNRYNALR